MTPVPPTDPYRKPHPWYRRYWGNSNRPYGGCGCFYVLLIVLLVWWLVSLLVPEVALWGSYF